MPNNRRARHRKRRTETFMAVTLFLLVVALCAIVAASYTSEASVDSVLTASHTEEPPQSLAESPTAAYVQEVVEPEPVIELEVYYDEVTDPDFHGYIYMWKMVDEIPLALDLQQSVFDASELYGVDMALILGMMECESSFRPDVSNGKCWGLMQIHSINYEWLLQDEGIDATTYDGNIEAGVLMISQLLDKYDEPHLALMAYNCGEAGARELWNRGIYSTDYTWAVISASEKWADVLENHT